MTYTHSTLVIAMLSVLSNGCAHSASPDCAPASTNYPDIANAETSYYQVRKDDTLYAISRFFALDYRQLAQWNRIEPPAYTIEIGQKIRLSDPVWGNKPTQEGSTPPRMRAVEQLPGAASKPGVLGGAVTVADDFKNGEGSVRQGAVADDFRDGGGRATHGAVAETKQKIAAVTATDRISPRKKVAIPPLNSKPNLAYKPSYKTQVLKNTAERYESSP